METKALPPKKVGKPETTPHKFMTTDPALTQVAAEVTAKKLNKTPEKVTVLEAQEELKKMAEEMGSS